MLYNIHIREQASGDLCDYSESYILYQMPAMPLELIAIACLCIYKEFLTSHTRTASDID
jgi:hypothetical protein